MSVSESSFPLKVAKTTFKGEDDLVLGPEVHKGRCEFPLRSKCSILSNAQFDWMLNLIKCSIWLNVQFDQKLNLIEWSMQMSGVSKVKAIGLTKASRETGLKIDCCSSITFLYFLFCANFSVVPLCWCAIHLDYSLKHWIGPKMIQYNIQSNDWSEIFNPKSIQDIRKKLFKMLDN